MFEYLERIKRLPPGQRRIFAFTVTVSLTGVIVVVWLTVLIMGDGLGHYRFEMAPSDQVTPPVEDMSWKNLLNEGRTEVYKPSSVEEVYSTTASSSDNASTTSSSSTPAEFQAPEEPGSYMDASTTVDAMVPPPGEDPFDPERLRQ